MASTSMLSTDFSHGWSSHVTHRLYRVEVTMQLTSDHVYIFSIDGLAFSQMPDKSMVRARAVAKPDASAAAPVAVSAATTAARRSSLGATNMSSSNVNNTSTNRMSVPNPSRGTFQSPAKADDFDPFAPSEAATASFDPFGNTSSPAQVAAPAKKQASAPPPSFDAFADSSDPFSSPAAAPAPAATAAKSFPGFDPFGSNGTPPAAVKSSVVAPPQPAAARSAKPSAQVSLLDAFDDQPAAPVKSSVEDVFATSKPSRRSSAQEIQMDFAGMSFAAPAPTSAAPRVVEKAPEPALVEVKEAAPVDPWATGLVDLNLSGRPAPGAKRNGSATAGPSLDSMMGGAGNQPARRSSLAGGQASQLTSTELINSLSDPFGAPALLTATPSGQHRPGAPGPGPVAGYGAQPAARPPMSAPLAISSLGGQQQPMPMGGGYGAPPPMSQQYQPQQPHHRASIGPMSGGSQPMARPSYNPSAYGGASQQPPKSSLDSLDWKA